MISEQASWLISHGDFGVTSQSSAGSQQDYKEDQVNLPAQWETSERNLCQVGRRVSKGHLAEELQVTLMTWW